MENTKPLAKSLHTVSVLVRVARHLQNSEPQAARPNNETAVDEALDLLGHRNSPDTYGLAAAAVRQLDAADAKAKPAGSKPIAVSTAFLNDRGGRDLPCGEELGTKGTKTLVAADAETLTDMVSDAAYQGWFTDADSGIKRAARTAFRDLLAGGGTYDKGTREENGLLVPADAQGGR